MNTTMNTGAASLSDAVKTALSALEAIAAEMTVGDRFTNAGQHLLDALPVCRAALSTPQADAAIADWRNLYEMVYGHECSFKSFMETVDELSRDAAIAAGGAQEPVATRAEIEHARDRVLAQSKNSLFRSGAKICASEILSPTKPCTKPPEGWTCSRVEGHEGPCAASPAASNGEQS
jgi:hypothetical protein